MYEIYEKINYAIIIIANIALAGVVVKADYLKVVLNKYGAFGWLWFILLSIFTGFVWFIASTSAIVFLTGLIYRLFDLKHPIDSGMAIGIIGGGITAIFVFAVIAYSIYSHLVK